VKCDDDGAWIWGLGDESRHGHAVDEDDAWTRCRSAHASVRNKIAPLGVRPPLLTTATRASFT